MDNVMEKLSALMTDIAPIKSSGEELQSMKGSRNELTPL